MSETTSLERTHGWKWLINATKWHYFVDGRSLCGKWMVLTMNGADDSNHDSPDNCAACRRKRKAALALGGEPAP